MNLQTQLDQVARLYILNGAVGAPMGTFQIPGEAAWMQTEHPNIDPAWFSAEDSGVYALAYRTVRGLLGEEDTEDLLQRAMVGLTPDEEDRTSPFYGIGRSAGTRKAILDGFSPLAVVRDRSFLTKALLRMVGNVVEKGQRWAHLLSEYPGPPPPEQGCWGHIHCILQDYCDPLGAELRHIFKGAWQGTLVEQEMNLWWDTFIGQGVSLRKCDMAQHTGIKSPALGARMMRGWVMAYRALAANEHTYNALVSRLELAGVVGPDFPAPEQVFGHNRMFLKMALR